MSKSPEKKESNSPQIHYTFGPNVRRVNTSWRNKSVLENFNSSNGFICEICGSIFGSVFVLRKHKRRHEITARYSCEYCSARFYTKCEVLQHYVAHYKKNYFLSCMAHKCNATFTSFGCLKAHLNEVHHIEPIASENRVGCCKICFLKFRTVRQYFRHIVNKHRDVVMFGSFEGLPENMEVNGEIKKEEAEPEEMVEINTTDDDSMIEELVEKSSPTHSPINSELTQPCSLSSSPSTLSDFVKASPTAPNEPMSPVSTNQPNFDYSDWDITSETLKLLAETSNSPVSLSPAPMTPPQGSQKKSSPTNSPVNPEIAQSCSPPSSPFTLGDFVKATLTAPNEPCSLEFPNQPDFDFSDWDITSETLKLIAETMNSPISLSQALSDPSQPVDVTSTRTYSSSNSDTPPSNPPSPIYFTSEDFMMTTVTAPNEEGLPNDNTPGSPTLSIRTTSDSVDWDTTAELLEAIAYISGSSSPASMTPPLDFQTCHYCEMIFKDPILYAMHRKLHSPDNPFKCALCGVECENVYMFTYHLIFAGHNAPDS